MMISITLRKQINRGTEKCEHCWGSQTTQKWTATGSWSGLHDLNFKMSKNTKEIICTDFLGSQKSSSQSKHPGFFLRLWVLQHLNVLLCFSYICRMNKTVHKSYFPIDLMLHYLKQFLWKILLSYKKKKLKNKVSV